MTTEQKPVIGLIRAYTGLVRSAPPHTVYIEVTARSDGQSVKLTNYASNFTKTEVHLSAEDFEKAIETYRAIQEEIGK